MQVFTWPIQVIARTITVIRTGKDPKYPQVDERIERIERLKPDDDLRKLNGYGRGH